MQKSLKIALFGATGMIGSRVAAEAAARGHQVTALSRDPSRGAQGVANVTSAKADLFDAASIAAALEGQDVVASAYGPAQGDPQKVVEASKALVAGVRAAGLKRLVVVGGAGSLEVAPGKQLVDAEGFPEIYKPVALAHRDAFNFYRTVNDLDWTFFAPAAVIAPGEKKGQFRTGANSLIADASGNSTISVDDYAVAFVDELEQGRFVRQIATVAY
ncbi:NAD-dependent epimerase/dehydratase family protein [Trinickia terrae]|uniref:NAD-dependent epimerase/dehydratase family protein n=1 Tax=Trinickia terrae TaxID=2571161 RepID=A0A4U1I0Q8_9BURK|nr:NAD(P)H-binding protein [Trinickia terrae]TKC86721.1 NAD-dependent epimerase/dehydratase family protein [Trinickia terrae]